jgi:hypothetical protein
MRSLSGFSGSPTFYNLAGADIVEVISVLMKKRYKIPPAPDAEFDDTSCYVWLLGIDAGNMPLYENVIERTDDGDEETDYRAINHSGFSVVIPAWKILEVLDREELVMERKKRAKEQKHVEGAMRSDSADDDTSTFTNYKFENFLKLASRKVSEPVEEKKETSE